MTGPSRLRAGDFVYVDLEPRKGTEQDGYRPALVISEAEYHLHSRRAFICPITRNVEPYPTKVVLPEGLLVTGAVLLDQARSVDRAARGMRILGAAPPSLLWTVRARLAMLIGLSPPPRSDEP